ncbi:unnamed protein product [Orchesella dallaii]|uniref:Uncharacterized protein n=1 Tax=Orchesella dallaii TaxID=48710 RepID=A0ABP1QU23_9HEXA
MAVKSLLLNVLLLLLTPSLAVSETSDPKSVYNFPVVSFCPELQCTIVLLLQKDGYTSNSLYKSFDFISPFSQESKPYHHFLLYDDVEKYNFRLNGMLTDNVTFSSGKWRFQQKFNKKCVSFFLSSSTLMSSLRLIDRSGFGHDNLVVFYLLYPTEDIISGFSVYFFKRVKHPVPYHVSAPVVLVTFDKDKNSTTIQSQDESSSLYYSLYCHFCPNGSKFLWTWFNNTLESIHHSKILLIHNKRHNKNGHGNIAYSILAYDSDRFMFHPECQIKSDEAYFRGKLPLKCGINIIHATMQRAINVTLVGRLGKIMIRGRSIRTLMMSTRLHDLDFRIGFLSTVSHVLLRTLTYSLMHCISESNVTLLRWDIYFRAFDISIWLSIFLIFIMYSYLTRNLRRGVDIMWTLLNQSTALVHSRKFQFFFLLGLTAITSVYQSIIATDFYKFGSLDSVEMLLKKGYKISVSNVETLKQALDPNLMPQKYRDIYQHYNESFITQANPLRTGFNVSEFLGKMVRNKVMLMQHSVDAAMLPLCGEQIRRIDNKYCGSFPFPLVPTYVGIYHWLFLSGGAHEVIRRMTDHGIVARSIAFYTHARVMHVKEKSKLYSSKWSRVVADPKEFGFSASMRYVCIAQGAALVIITVGFLVVKYWCKLRGHTTSKTSVETVSSVMFLAEKYSSIRCKGKGIDTKGLN